jgi:DeoR/GlpR family transcriptional regulator of sugar metabolism
VKKTTDRHQTIVELVRTRKANVEELCAALGVSEATIRRDLSVLEKQRRLVRTYGGATALVGMHEPEASLEERKAAQYEQKEAIALAAAAHVREGDTVLLDVARATPCCSTGVRPAPRLRGICRRGKTCMS